MKHIHHLTHNLKVAASNPAPATKNFFKSIRYIPPSLWTCEGVLRLATSFLLPVLLPAVRIFHFYAHLSFTTAHICSNQSCFILASTF